eukprot:jgi/Chlat1/7842/Chrsp66S07341
MTHDRAFIVVERTGPRLPIGVVETGCDREQTLTLVLTQTQTLSYYSSLCRASPVTVAVCWVFLHCSLAADGVLVSSSKRWRAGCPALVAFVMSVTLHTNLGEIKCEIFCDEVPKAAENFLALCASGFYDGTIFHRNIKGFMIQGGDPTGTGKGGTSIWGKKFTDEIRDNLKHNARGTLSMANSGPNTNGSQFFISYAKQPHLNGLYTIFGKVISGFETLDLMEKTPTGPGDRPLAEIRLNRVTIHANPLAS